ncbi:MAG: alpha/beta fold hydrolase [Desulfobacteraceae bacterium]|nr:alpha/beta fold hydrolase [Desulfobacteraceae bacterium]
MNKIPRVLFLMICFSLLLGCFPARAPMRTLSYSAPEANGPRALFVFFPGIGGTYKDFEKKGLIDDLQEKFPGADAIALDAGFGYYRKRTLDQRVKEDVLKKLDLKAYDRVYLVGISMGGLGTLLTARRYPKDIDGLLLISPFLGWSDILEEISDAGGVGNWSAGDYTEEDWQRMIWDLLKRKGDGSGNLPPVYLAYGEEDTYVNAHKLLQQVIPSDRVISRPGKHNIPTFQTLWRDLLIILPTGTVTDKK